MDTTCEEKSVGGGVVKLAAVGTLNSLNGGPKLGVNIGKKNFSDSVESVRFKM